jgi:head-tail adaptor
MSDLGELAGRMAERVVIEHWQDARGDDALATGGWVTGASVAAAVAAERGADMAPAGDALRGFSRWRVTLRAPVTVGLTSRLWWRGERLEVLAVERDLALPDRVVLRCRSRG